tara:strand:- start:192 stop:407 length:216 start_codon:yes stop_codon:yes gene_type:complete
MKFPFDETQETYEEYLRRINLDVPGAVIYADCKDRPGTVFSVNGKEERNKTTYSGNVSKSHDALVDTKKDS